MSFQFGASTNKPAAAAAPAASLFGQPTGSTGGASMFNPGAAKPAAAPNAAQPFNFGATKTGSLFGGSGTAGTAPAAATTSSLFGSTAFGGGSGTAPAPTGAAAPQQQQSTLFGLFGTGTAPAPPAQQQPAPIAAVQQQPSLFGGTAAQAAVGPTATAPAAAPMFSGAFGSGSSPFGATAQKAGGGVLPAPAGGASSLFGGNVAATAQPNTAAQPFSFGAQKTGSTAPPFGAVGAAAGSITAATAPAQQQPQLLFGGTAKVAGAPAGPTAAAPSLFGFGGTTATTAPAFGVAPTATVQPAAAATSAAVPAAGGTAPTLFSGTIGGGPKAAQPTAQLFGIGALTAAPAASPTVGAAAPLFSTIAATGTTAPARPFGTTATTQPAAFGGTTATAPAPLFGPAATAPAFGTAAVTATAQLFGIGGTTTTATASAAPTVPPFGITATAPGTAPGAAIAPASGGAATAPTVAPISSAAPLFGTGVVAPAGTVTTATTAAVLPLFSATATTTAPPSAAVSGAHGATTVPGMSGSTPLAFGGTQAVATTTTTTLPIFGGAAPAAATSLAPTSIAPAAMPAPKKMNFKDLEQTLAKLRMDFEQQEKSFLDELDDLNAFDVVLRKAQDKVLSLGGGIDELETEKNRFVWELDILSQQQTELDTLVTEMEKQLALPADTQQLSGQPSVALRDPVNATPADVQRQNILQLQMAVNAQMKQLDDELGDLCEQISDLQRVSGLPVAAGSSSLTAADLDEQEERRSLVDQIRTILRSQLETLVWVDKQSEALMDRVQRTTSDVLTLR